MCPRRLYTMESWVATPSNSNRCGQLESSLACLVITRKTYQSRISTLARISTRHSSITIPTIRQRRELLLCRSLAGHPNWDKRWLTCRAAKRAIWKWSRSVPTWMTYSRGLGPATIITNIRWLSSMARVNFSDSTLTSARMQRLRLNARIQQVELLKNTRK